MPQQSLSQSHNNSFPANFNSFSPGPPPAFPSIAQSPAFFIPQPSTIRREDTGMTQYWTPDSKHYDTNKVMGNPIPRTVPNNKETDAMGIPRIDTMQLRAYELFRNGPQSYPFRMIANGRVAGVEILKTQSEKALMMALQSFLKSRRKSSDSDPLFVLFKRYAEDNAMTTFFDQNNVQGMKVIAEAMFHDLFTATNSWKEHQSWHTPGSKEHQSWHAPSATAGMQALPAPEHTPTPGPSEHHAPTSQTSERHHEDSSTPGTDHKSTAELVSTLQTLVEGQKIANNEMSSSTEA